MALSKPTVVNDHPEQRFVIEKSGGGICVPYNETDFARAVVYLLKHPEIRKTMGAKGKRWVLDNRTYSKISDLVEKEYYRRIRFN